MGNGPQSLDNVLELGVTYHQGVTSGEQYVTDNRSPLYVFDALLYPVVGDSASFCPAKRRRVQ